MNVLETTTAGWYNAFYLLSIGVAAIAMRQAGRDRGHETDRWSVAVLAWIVGGVIGAMLPHQLTPEYVTASKTMLGGIAGATVGLIVCAAWLRLPVIPSLDATALAIPLGAAVARIGCYLADCCHGIETGISFMPRHPVQIYDAVLEVCLAIVLNRRMKRALPHGSAILMSVAGVGAIRFVTEFVRESERLGVLSLAQWIVLPVMLGCVAALTRRSITPVVHRARGLRSDRRWPAAALGVALTALLVGPSLSPLEVTAICLAILGTLAVIAHRGRAIAPAGMAALILQAPADYPKTLFHIGGGPTAGQYTSLHTGENCEGDEIERWTRRNHYAMGGLEFGARQQLSRTRGQGIRLGGMAGSLHSEAAQVTSGTPGQPGAFTQQIHGLSAIADMDWTRFGLSLGGSFGQFATATDRDNGGIDPGFDRLLAVGVRFGRLDGTSLEVRFGDNPPAWSPAPIATFAAGFGDTLGNRLQVGVSEMGGFLSVKRRVGGDMELTPFIGGISGIAGVQSSVHGGLMVRRWIEKR